MKPKYKTEKDIKTKHVKSTIKAIMICIVTCAVAYYINGDTFKKYLLLKYGITTKGMMIEVKQDATDGNNGETNLQFYYTYTFSANGRTITGYGVGDGEIPSDLVDVNERPLVVDVLYANNDPTLNSVKYNDSSSPDNVLLRGIIGCIVVLSAGFYIAFLAFKHSYDEYNAEMAVLNNPEMMAYRAEYLRKISK